MRGMLIRRGSASRLLRFNTSTDSIEDQDMSVEGEAARLATAILVKQFVREGVAVDQAIRKELEMKIKDSVSKCVQRADSLHPLDKHEIAKEAIGLTNVTSLKLQARKAMLHRKIEKLTTEQKWYIIRPNDYRKVIWDFYCVFLLTYSIFEMPFSLAYRSSSNCQITAIEIVNLFVDFCFCVDGCLSFITAYVDYETGIIVMNPSRIISRSCTSGENHFRAALTIFSHWHSPLEYGPESHIVKYAVRQVAR
jgi:hypothetical protein